MSKSFILASAKTTAGTLKLRRSFNEKEYKIVLQSNHGTEVLEEINKHTTDRAIIDTARYLWNEYCMAYGLQA